MDRRYSMESRSIIGTLLRETRSAAGVVQEDLAERLRRSQSYISRIERGEIRLGILQLREILEAIGADMTTFIARIEELVARRRSGDE